MTFRLADRGIPGRFVIALGTVRDYRQLAHFHYCGGAPATWAAVWTIRYFARERSMRWTHLRPHALHGAKGILRATSRGSAGSAGRLVAVAVLSFPLPSTLARRAALGLTGSRHDELRFANRHVRTISRVIVHPQFRSLGLAARLIRRVCARCDTRYVESMSVMGRAHPLFERAGMRRIDPPRAPKGSWRKPGRARPGTIVYYLFDRKHPSIRARDAPSKNALTPRGSNRNSTHTPKEGSHHVNHR